MSSTLYIVATPIGNLEDLSFRALRILRECDLVVAEDTRKTRVLLSAHNIKVKLLSLPAYAEAQRSRHVINILNGGQDIALCTDAGTPTISDPGSKLVVEARQQGHKVVPIPGPSAVITALSASGFSASRFVYLGFLPRTKSKAMKVVGSALNGSYTVVFLESPLRLVKMLEAIGPLLGERKVMIARELTKIYETYYLGTVSELVDYLGKKPPKGECTVLIEAGKPGKG